VLFVTDATAAAADVSSAASAASAPKKPLSVPSSSSVFLLHLHFVKERLAVVNQCDYDVQSTLRHKAK